MSTQGSIKKASNGTWSFVVDVPAAVGQRKQLRRRGFPTKKAAQAELTRLTSDVQRGSFVRPTRDRFGAYLETWLEGLPAAGRRTSTINGYRMAIRAHVVPTLGDVELQAVRATDLDALYSKLLGKGLSMSTVRKLHAVLGKALNDAMRKGLVPINVARLATPPSASASRAPEMTSWTPAELRSFLAGIEEHPQYPLFRLAAMTGLRRGELCGLRWSDVDLDASTLTVRQTIISVDHKLILGDVKTSRSRRKVDLDPATVVVLRGWRKRQLEERLLVGPRRTETGLVFTDPTGRGVNPTTVSQTFARLQAARAEAAHRGASVDVVQLRRIRFHDLRHTHASHMLAAGINVKVVSERLGHASVAFTLDTYAHVMPGQQAEAAAAAAALID